MDARRKRFIKSLLPQLFAPPPNGHEWIKDIISLITLIKSIPKTPDHRLHFRQFCDNVNSYEGRDVFTVLCENRYDFYQISSETPETLLSLVQLLDVQDNRVHKLSLINRVFLFMLWLRSYPTYYMLSNLFCVSSSTVKCEIQPLLPVFRRTLNEFITWPTIEDWGNMRGSWEKIQDAVGAIDGTSHEIYKPMSEPEQQFYSGHRRYHAIHTQVIVDVNGIIRHVESGFVGHLNDAQQYALMQSIGADLPFPEDCVLLGDKIYPNRDPIMTPYTNAQLARKNERERVKCKKLNRYISQYRVKVENAVAELKTYKVIGTLRRHPRNNISDVVFVCAALVCRRKQMGLIL